MKTCAIIYNPNSGRVLKPKHIKQYKKTLKNRNYNVKTYRTEYSGHAREIVNHMNKVDLVISMGGDGTFNEVMNGNLKRKERLVLAHIPVGTTNDIGAMFGYSKDINENLDLVLNGEIKEMDICMINNSAFVYVAGFGKFTDIPYLTPRDLKKRFGFMAYLSEGIKDFLKPTKLYETKIKIDGIEKKGKYSLMLISNANRVAGINNFYKDIKLDDDTFEVLLCKVNKRTDVLRAFSKLLTTNVEKINAFELYKTNNIEITFKNLPKQSWTIDGEKLNESTHTFAIRNERNVKIMVPRKNINELFLK